MKNGQFSTEQIITILELAERGDQSVSAICRTHGVAETTLYRWRKHWHDRRRGPAPARLGKGACPPQKSLQRRRWPPSRVCPSRRVLALPHRMHIMTASRFVRADHCNCPPTSTKTGGISYTGGLVPSISHQSPVLIPHHCYAELVPLVRPVMTYRAEKRAGFQPVSHVHHRAAEQVDPGGKEERRCTSITVNSQAERSREHLDHPVKVVVTAFIL